jgi:DNA-binding transcriptional LysR family regulator
LWVRAVPDLRQLRTFVAVAEERNFTRAAQRLHLAQQAVSKSVAQLEAELGVELLERTTREVRLTAAGASLLEDGRELLTAADAAFARAVEVGRGLSGTVRVGVSPALGPALRTEVVRVLRDGADDLSVSVLEVRPRDVARMLHDRELDLVLAHTSRGEPEVDSASLRPEPVELVVPEGHRLADRASVRLAELDGERLLVRSPVGTPFTDLLLNRLAAAGAHVEPVEARVTGAMAFDELAATGSVALRAVDSPPVSGVVEVALEDDVTLPLVLLWRAGAPSAAVRRVRAAMSG